MTEHDTNLDTGPKPSAELAFDYEDALLRGSLLPAERDAVIAKLATGAEMKAAAADLGLPLDVVMKSISDPAAISEIVSLALAALRVEFMVDGMRQLMDVVRHNADPRAKTAAARLIADILGMRDDSPEKKKALRRNPNVSSLERAVREAKPS